MEVMDDVGVDCGQKQMFVYLGEQVENNVMYFGFYFVLGLKGIG